MHAALRLHAIIRNRKRANQIFKLTAMRRQHSTLCAQLAACYCKPAMRACIAVDKAAQHLSAWQGLLFKTIPSITRHQVLRLDRAGAAAR